MSWTTLGELPAGSLFETKDGTVGIKYEPLFASFRFPDEGPQSSVVLVGRDNLGELPSFTPVKVIDLPFLLAAASDRLAESEAYQRGRREGQEAMRDRAARLAESLRRPVYSGLRDTVVGTQAALADEAAEAIRELPLD